MQSKRGILICFEGTDRSARTTQIGKVIDQYLRGETRLSLEAAHLLFSANRWEYQEAITTALANGKSVILDRYVHSGIAYSVSKGLDVEWCLLADSGLPKPDIVFYLHQSKALEDREGFGKEINDHPELQTKVSAVYDKLKESNWVIIDAKLKIDLVELEVRQYTEKALDSLQQNGIKLF